MLVNSINMLIRARRIQNLNIVLYTDCVRFETQELSEFFNNRVIGTNINFCIPKNVYYELSFMAQNSKVPRFRNNADLILRNCRDKRLDWNLEDFYEAYSKHIPSVPSPCLFVFSPNSLKQKEFITNVPRGTQHYVWCNEHDCKPIDTAKSSRYSTYPVCGISFCNASDEYDAAVFEYSDINNNVSKIRIKENQTKKNPIVGGGAEATVYEYNDQRLNGKCIKKYETKRRPTGATLNKLRMLRKLGLIFPDMDVAFPDAIMFADGVTDKAVGLSMKKAKGNTLHYVITHNSTSYEFEEKKIKYSSCIKKIFTVLLDLHCYGIYVSDLSANNIMFDETTGEICFIDCDSFQVLNYPGGGCYPDAKHKDIERDRMEDTLRYPLHEDFALAVLLYKIFVWHKLYIKRNDEKYLINWGTDIFQLDYPNEYPEITFGRSTLEPPWNALDEQLKILFADEFHFRKSFGIGSWIEALGFNC